MRKSNNLIKSDEYKKWNKRPERKQEYFTFIECNNCKKPVSVLGNERKCYNSKFLCLECQLESED